MLDLPDGMLCAILKLSSLALSALLQGNCIESDSMLFHCSSCVSSLMNRYCISLQGSCDYDTCVFNPYLTWRCMQIEHLMNPLRHGTSSRPGGIQQGPMPIQWVFKSWTSITPPDRKTMTLTIDITWHFLTCSIYDTFAYLPFPAVWGGSMQKSLFSPVSRITRHSHNLAFAVISPRFQSFNFL